MAANDYAAIVDDPDKRDQVMVTCLETAAIRPEAALRTAVGFLAKGGNTQVALALTKRGKELGMVGEDFNPTPASFQFVWWLVIGLAVVGLWSLVQ